MKNIYCFFIISLWIALGATTLASESNGVIATIDGRNLGTEKLPSKLQRVSFARNQSQKESVSEADLRMHDVAVLVDWVLENQKQKAIKQFKISVSNEEVRRKLQNIYKDDDSYLERTNEILEILPKALREAKANPDKEKEIYQKYLRGYMSYELWQKHVEANYTEEKLRGLETHKPLNEEEMYKSVEPVRKILLEQKLRENVTKDAGNAAEKESAWQNWCRKQLQKAPVEIYDIEIRGAYKAFIENVSQQTTNQTAVGVPQIPGSGKTNDLGTAGNTGKP